MSIPDGVRAAIRLWLADETNGDTSRGPEYIAENLAAYLFQAGFRIAPLDTIRSRRLLRARGKGTHTDGQWKALVQWAGDACVCCHLPFLPGRLEGGSFVGGRLPQKDHIIALANDGDDSIDNIQPLCGPCNVKKLTKSIDYRHPSWREAVLGGGLAS